MLMSQENNKIKKGKLYIIILFLLGAIFIVFGTLLGKTDKSYNEYEKYIENTEKRLEEFLLEVKGIKKVEVILSTEFKTDGDDGIYCIKGAVIACTNGDDDKTKAEITDIVSKYLGIGANKVKITDIKQ